MINYEIMIKKGQHVHRSEAMAKRVANKPSDKQKKDRKKEKVYNISQKQFVHVRMRFLW